MKSLGFQYSKYVKGYVDGHERSDVVNYRVKYLLRVKILEDTHKPPPTCSDGIHPYPIGKESADKELVLIFHDECILHSNDGRKAGWHEPGKVPLLPKDQGKGIMVTDFADEHCGYLRLSDEEKQRADDTIPPMAREVLVFGSENEGYFTSEKFLLQVAKAARIAHFKYPPETHGCSLHF